MINRMNKRIALFLLAICLISLIFSSVVNSQTINREYTFDSSDTHRDEWIYFTGDTTCTTTYVNDSVFGSYAMHFDERLVDARYVYRQWYVGAEFEPFVNLKIRTLDNTVGFKFFVRVVADSNNTTKEYRYVYYISPGTDNHEIVEGMYDYFHIYLKNQPQYASANFYDTQTVHNIKLDLNNDIHRLLSNDWNVVTFRYFVIYGSYAIDDVIISDGDPISSTTPIISLSNSYITFNANEGGANPANQSVTITNAGDGTLNWIASESLSWLSLTNSSGISGQSVQLNADISNLTAAGSPYTGTVTVSASGASNEEINVVLNISEQSSGDTVWETSGDTIYYTNGFVGIGTTQPQSEFSVNGEITAKEVTVTTSGWADFIFEPGYRVPTLSQVEQHIHEKGHLPDIPSAAEVEANGVSVGEMQAKLLQKIEELTLYTIELQKQVTNQQQKIDKLETKIETRVKITKMFHSSINQ